MVLKISRPGRCSTGLPENHGRSHLTGTCPAEESRVLSLLDDLAERYPRSRDIPRYRYTYLEARGYAHEDLMPILRDAQRRSRGDVWLYLALISEQVKANDPPGIYATAGHWLRSDRKRYNLPQLKAMFESRPGVSAEVGPGDD